MKVYRDADNPLSAWAKSLSNFSDFTMSLLVNLLSFKTFVYFYSTINYKKNQEKTFIMTSITPAEPDNKPTAWYEMQRNAQRKSSSRMKFISKEVLQAQNCKSRY